MYNRIVTLKHYRKSAQVTSFKMKNLIIVLIAITILAGVFFWLKLFNKNVPFIKPESKQGVLPSGNEIPQVKVIAENLDTPWSIVFLPDKSILVTERPGRVRLINKSGNLQSEPVATFNNVKEIGEGGLLGIALHPNFSNNNYVYLYYTYNEDGGNTLNRVVRMVYENKQLKNEQIIVDKIPGASNHNGGRIKFGPDGYLYITTGDAQNPSQAQDINTLAGKILRVTDQGKPAQDNPFNNLVYSYGHRNPQGLAWSRYGRLWVTEHGSEAFDEVNVVNLGENYGWPDIKGDQKQDGMQTPFVHSGNDTWAPSGNTIKDDILYFVGLRGQTLYSLNIKPKITLEIEKEKIAPRELLKGQFGRLRDVVLGPDNLLYITTSNRDGRGNPNVSDDKIIRINPQKL